jgi:bifunctional non-homologous end joining protein LigD
MPRAPALSEYRKKRDFARTAEPLGRARGPAAGFSFVVQKHAARRLHYDFRLELDGVLLSWAVPKGPSLDPRVKRLAVQTEDHPIEYGTFEGAIPKGEYGGGTVQVWDRGQWVPNGDPRRAYARGRLTFELEGTKLHGTWHLVKTAGRADRSGKRDRTWILFKGKDAGARSGAPLDDEDARSVLTGRTIEEIARDPERVWRSSKPASEASEPVKRPGPGPVKARSRRAATERVIEVGRIRLTHPDRVLYGEQGITKGDLALYYARVASWMLPHVAKRPLMLVRCPEGHSKECFHQKHPSKGLSPDIHRIVIPEKKKRDQSLYVEDIEGLMALVQMGVLEIHTWGCRVEHVECPDQLVLDLDPDPELEWSRVVEGAATLRARLRQLGLESFVKTTGGKGLHVVVPVRPRTPWSAAKGFTKALVEEMTRRDPDRYLPTMTKAKRKGKIFLDYLRNGRGATAIAAYSTRARRGAPVSVPIAWEELARLRSDSFDVSNVPERLARLARDPWHEFGRVGRAQSLTSRAMRALGV